MRRTIEVAVILLFAVLGVMLVFGLLPLPQFSVDMETLLPAGASEAASASCSTCSADCPYAGGASEEEPLPGGSLEPVDGVLLEAAKLRDEFPSLRELPLSGGAVAGYRTGRPEGEPRIWVDIGTCSSPDEAAAWYRRHLHSVGWELVRDDDTTVPDALFLSFEQSGKVINILIEERSDRTNIFLDLPAPVSRL